MSYLMESTGEGRRLKAQNKASPSLERLLAAGLAPGMRAADLGCGSGAALPSMLEVVGPGGSVVGADPNPGRLEEARQALEGEANVELVAGGLPDSGLPAASFDFAWSQFVFEYLPSPGPALAEMVRITRPGGRVVVADVDGAGLHFWPSSPVLNDGVERLQQALQQTGYDLFVGRKLFQLFQQAGLREVRVRVSPFYVASGGADALLVADWRQRFEVLTPVAAPHFGGESAYRHFARAYLDMLADPHSFTYAVVLTAEGTRA